MSVTEEGILMLLMDLQEENARLPIFLRITILNCVHPQNASSLIAVTVGGTVMHTKVNAIGKCPFLNHHETVVENQSHC